MLPFVGVLLASIVWRGNSGCCDVGLTWELWNTSARDGARRMEPAHAPESKFCAVLLGELQTTQLHSQHAAHNAILDPDDVWQQHDITSDD